MSRLPGRRETPWAAIGEDWFNTLGEMKGAAMKLGQLASQYADLLPPELAAPLARLQREAVPRAFAEIDAVLRQQWSAQAWAQIDWLDPTAMAAASIGQVHRARLVDGREVVVKVRYPGVAEAVDEDVDALGRLLRMGRLLQIDRAALDGLLAEVRVRFREETDYAQELRHLENLRTRAAHPAVRYPEPVPELCGEAVLVTRYCPADSLAEAVRYPQPVRDRLGTVLLEWSLSQVFQAGVIHADPHPGNFGFAMDGTITVYDFGCVKPLASRLPPQLLKGLSAALDGDVAALHAVLFVLDALPVDAHDPQLRQQLGATLAPAYRAMLEVTVARLMAEPQFDFADTELIDEARRVVRQHLRLWRLFRPVPPLAFAARAVSGHYWMLRALGARVPVAGLLRHWSDTP